MPQSQHRAGVFDAVAGVALLFMLIGIGLGALQWVRFKAEPTATFRKLPPEKKPGLPDEAGKSDEADETDEAGGEDADDTPDADAGAGADADAPADDVAPGADAGGGGDEKGPAGGEDEMDF